MNTNLKKNSKILLIYELKGAIAGPVSNANTKEEIIKMKKSPCEHVSNNKIIIPKHCYKAPNDFKERSTQKCVHKTTLNESCVQYMITDDSCPIKIKLNTWKKMNSIQKIEAHLSLISDGNPFTYQILN